MTPMGGEIAYEHREMQQYCPSCNVIRTVPVVYGRDRGMVVSDRSTCPCGRVLWDWIWVKTKEPYSRPAERPKREQLRLFDTPLKSPPPSGRR